MSEKESIRGKVDNGKHEGKRSEVLRKLETEQQIIDFWAEVWPELVELHRGDIVELPEVIEKGNFDLDA